MIASLDGYCKTVFNHIATKVERDSRRELITTNMAVGVQNGDDVTCNGNYTHKGQYNNVQ